MTGRYRQLTGRGSRRPPSAWARTPTTPRRRPRARSPSTGSGSTATRSPTAQFAAFVAATGYATVAERPLDPAAFPGAPAENLVAGLAGLHAHARARSTCATSTSGGRGRRARAGARPRARASTLAGREEHPVVHVAYEDAERVRRHGPAPRCRPRPNGSWPRAAGSTARPTPGATSPSRPARGWRTTGTATSRGARSPATGRPRRSARSRPTPSGCSTWPATSGSGRTDWYGGSEAASRDPCPAAVRDPAQGRQGRLVPVRRQLLPALPPRRAPPADGRHRHEPRRLPLRTPSRLSVTAANPPPGDESHTRRSPAPVVGDEASRSARQHGSGCRTDGLACNARPMMVSLRRRTGGSCCGTLRNEAPSIAATLLETLHGAG